MNRSAAIRRWVVVVVLAAAIGVAFQLAAHNGVLSPKGDWVLDCDDSVAYLREPGTLRLMRGAMIWSGDKGSVKGCRWAEDHAVEIQLTKGTVVPQQFRRSPVATVSVQFVVRE